MKKIIAGIVLLFLIFSTPVFAATSDNGNIDVPSDWQEIFDESPVGLDQWNTLSFPQLVSSLFSVIQGKLKEPLKLFFKTIALLIFASLVRGLTPNSDSSISSMIDTIITLAVFTVCSVPILGLIDNMITAIETSKNYLSAFVPVFVSVLTSCGQIGSAAIYGGFFFSSVMLIANVLCHWALPSIRVFFALSIMDGVCDVINFSKITAICSKLAKWLLMLCATVFVAVMGLQTSIADAADSVAMKTGKLFLSASVPVIGRAVSDALGSVYAGLKLLKGTAGIALVGVLAASFVPLIIEAAVYYILLNVSSMVAGATGNKSSEKLFSGISEGISMSMLFIFFFCVMSILATIMMILAGGGA